MKIQAEQKAPAPKYPAIVKAAAVVATAAALAACQQQQQQGMTPPGAPLPPQATGGVK
jgi:hypothetical protein